MIVVGVASPAGSTSDVVWPTVTTMRTHESRPRLATTAGPVHTAAGWPPVTSQIAALNTLADPSTNGAAS
jgi:hypothetical protein